MVRRAGLPEEVNAPEGRTRAAIAGLVVEVAMAIAYMVALAALTAAVVWL